MLEEMKVDTLVIVVYNRFQNIIHWMSILTRLELNVNVVVIHNDNSETLPAMNGITYIKRPNIGFDIGAFQDVCKGNLIQDWKRLLWLTDDCFPMYPNFLDAFEGDGVICMKISPYVREHIRTTGFAISRHDAIRLIFPADPITTKDHCYQFEHRSVNHFLHQCKVLGIQVKQAAPDATSPLWDIGYHRKLDRYAEFKQQWDFDAPTTADLISVNSVEVICPIYKQFPAIISSMIMQTHQNWRLKLIHDGPDDSAIESYVRAINDDRIEFIIHEHRGNWGHSYRSEYLAQSKGDYTLITNADNYHAPNFLERLIPKVKDVAAYCAQMVHSYKNWEVINCRLQRGYVDCAGVLLNTKKAQQVGWNNTTDHSADWLFFADLIRKFGVASFKPVRGCLLVHN